MSALTCTYCQVKFVGANVELSLKEHFKSDWHSFNLKRREFDLGPITAEAFNERLLRLKQEETTKTEKATSWHCAVCRKKFSSENTYKDHVRSKKHEVVNNEDQWVDDDDEEEEEIVEEDENDKEETEDILDEKQWEPLSISECFFCDKTCKDVNSNIEHMLAVHGFFLPHKECITDLNGLMTYLGSIIGEYHMCLWCGQSNFLTKSAIKHHMLDKGHCKLMFDGEDSDPEYSKFYCNEKLPVCFQGPLDDLELTLPSGATIGHRELVSYYKQKTGLERVLVSANSLSSAPKQHMLGWNGATTAAIAKRMIDIKHAERNKNKNMMRLGVKSNKLQRHFRDQTFGF